LTRQDVNQALPQTSFPYGAMECGLSSLVLCTSQGRSARLRVLRLKRATPATSYGVAFASLAPSS
jgi:hypothetical protein